MTPRLLIASLLAVAATADADPTPAPAPARAASSPTCRATGEVLLAIHHLRIGNPTSDIALYASGAWTLAETEPERSTWRRRGGRGCLATDVLTKLKRELAAMPWKLSAPEDACDALPAEAVRFTPKGKHAFTDEVCAIQALDPTSRSALADVTQILEAAFPPVVSLALHGPPCCKRPAL